MVRGDFDGNDVDDLLIDFGPSVGLWIWMNHSSWVHLHGLSPSQMVAGDLDANGLDEAVLVFPGFGLWVWSNNALWTHINTQDATSLAVANRSMSAAVWM